MIVMRGGKSDREFTSLGEKRGWMRLKRAYPHHELIYSIFIDVRIFSHCLDNITLWDIPLC